MTQIEHGILIRFNKVNVTLSTGVDCVLYHVPASYRYNSMEPFYKENILNYDVPIFNKPAVFQSSLKDKTFVYEIRF